jgi:hypothetical protein
MSLTDTQLVLLSTAAQHEDHLFTLPAAQKARAVQNALKSLLRQGLAEELIVSTQQPHWRMNDTGQLVGFRITATGLGILGIEPAEGMSHKSPPDTPLTIPTQPEAEPRAGTKRDLLLQLLHRELGATINELMAATGWLPHTIRSALTGLRKKGYKIERIRGEAGSTYRIHSATGELG